MTPDAAFRDLIRDNAGVAALVNGRVYPSFVPQDKAYPAITFFRVDTARVLSQDTPRGLYNARFQVDCWDATPDGTWEVAEAVLDALAGFRGTHEGVKFGGIIPADEADGPYEEGAKLFRRRIEFFTWIQEAA